MSDDVYIRFGNSKEPIGNVMERVERAMVPTTGDLLYAGQRQRTRVLARTARGVDVNETAFAPYSTRGPYYYYPGKDAKNRGAAVTRFARQVGLKTRAGKTNTYRVTRTRVSASRLGEKKAWAQRTRLGIKFSSYAAFKASLGRAFVDLRGPRAPHMLQGIIVRVRDFVLGNETTVSPDPNSTKEPANTITLGIYGEEAERAEGHNTGAGRLPKRRFFGASEQDKIDMINDIVNRAIARARLAIRGTK